MSIIVIYIKEKSCSNHSYNGKRLKETITILINKYLLLLLDVKRQIELLKK